jgi:aconitase A
MQPKQSLLSSPLLLTSEQPTTDHINPAHSLSSHSLQTHLNIMKYVSQYVQQLLGLKQS